MKKIWNFLTRVSAMACSTVALFAMGEASIHAATITGDFKISGLVSGEVTDDFVIGRFEGEDLDENGILSESELKIFSADIVGDGLSLIQDLELENVFDFELDLEQLDFEFFFGKSAMLGDLLFSNPSIPPICVRPDGGPCLLEEINLSEDLAYFFDFEYGSVSDLRFLGRVRIGATAFGTAEPPTVEVTLNPQHSQTVPEPSMILGFLAVLGLGSKFKKVS